MRQFNRSLTGFMVIFILLCVTGSFSVSLWAAPQESEKELPPDEVWAQKGLEFIKKKEYPAALECYQMAFKLKPKEISWTINLSVIYCAIENFPESLQVLEDMWDTFSDEENRKQILMARADVHFYWGENLRKKYDHLKAIKHYKEAYKIDKNLRPKNATVDLLNIGGIYDTLGERDKALGYYEQALPLGRATSDRILEAATLNNIGKVYNELGENNKALGYYEQALPIVRAIGDRRGEAAALNNIGKVYNEHGEKEKALWYFEQALQIVRDIGERGGEAAALNNIGQVYSSLDENNKALGYYEQALPIFLAVGDRIGESTTRKSIGMVYASLGAKDKALSYGEQALQIVRACGDRVGEAVTLNFIGRVYDSLGAKDKALGYYEQALPIFLAVGDHHGEATTLNNIGMVYSSLGEKEKALGYYEQALPLRRAVGDRGGEAATLSNIGLVYYSLGVKDKALDYYEQALPIVRAVGDRGGEAAILNNIGLVYDSLGEKEKALGYYEQTLHIIFSIGDRSSEADILSNLMVHWDASNNKPMAIFYGKQAVNNYQQLRKNIATLPNETKLSYLNTVQDTYRYLVDLLINQSRLGEALLVMDMLKDAEYFQFIRRDRSATRPGTSDLKLDFTPFEQEWLQKYNTSLESVASISSQYQDLLTIKPKNPAEQKRLLELETQLKNARQAFDINLNLLKDAFAAYNQKVKPGEYEGINLTEKAKALQSTLQYLDEKEGGRNVALHYLVFGGKIRIILTTPVSQIDRFSSINQEELNKMILNYQDTINSAPFRGATLKSHPSPTTTPLTPTALYDLIFKPIEKDLQEYGATNLLVYLDGVLRYIPLPTLWDGQNFLLQRYRISIFTTSSLPNIKDVPAEALKVLGMAAAKGSTDLSELPYAKEEINAIVKNETQKGSTGLITGTALIDEMFTKTAMLAQLKTATFPLVHIASHFQFSPGDETQNFLLLGDGNKLSLKDIRYEGTLFHHVDLLVLAACQTAMGGGNGEEIDGFGELAQQSGAKSVVASLWKVNDQSSKDLMVSFYQNIKDGKYSSKIEALRQAQLELAGLDDLLQPNPPHKRDKTDYASPYYWGPFIMMGNWR